MKNVIAILALMISVGSFAATADRGIKELPKKKVTTTKNFKKVIAQKKGKTIHSNFREKEIKKVK